MSIPSELNQALGALETALDRNSEDVSQEFTKVLEIIAQNGTLWKSFKTWTKQNHISNTSLDRLNVAQVAKNILLSTKISKPAVSSLKNSLLATEQLHSGQLISQSSSHSAAGTAAKLFLSLKQFDADFLRSAIAKNHRKLEKVMEIVASYEALKNTVSPEQKIFIENLQVRLQIWALQYLARGAKIPILEQRGPIHLPFLEYHNDNMNEYYRQGGGAITSLLLDFLKKTYHLPKDENYIFEIIKPNIFSTISQAACEIQNITYRPPSEDVDEDSLEKLPAKIKNGLDGTFFNITTPLQSSFAQGGGIGIQELMKTCCEAAKESKKVALFGGEILIGDQTCYILFPCPTVDGLAHQVRALRGSLGAIPEMSSLRRQLVKEGFQLKDVLEYSALQRSQQKPVKLDGTFEQVILALEKLTQAPLTPRSLIAQTYFPIFQQLLSTVQQFMSQDLVLKQSHHLAPLTHAIENVGKRIKNISQIESIPGMLINKKFQEVMQEFYLAAEELTFILCFPKLQTVTGSSSHLQQTIQDLSPASDFKQSFVCTSGMSGFLHVLEGLREIYTVPLAIAFLDSSYYELVSGIDFGGYLGLFAKYDSYSSEDLLDLQESPDLICMDIYPNNVLMSVVNVPPFKEIIAKHLAKRSEASVVDRPLTVILDATSALFWSEPIQMVLKEFSKDIEERRLNLVVVSSLAKFAMCGLDKYTGGAIQTYNNFSKQSPLHAFNQYLMTIRESDAPSPEADAFFLLFMRNEASALKEYMKCINDNTEYVYNALMPLRAQDSLIRLGIKDRNIPMLGFVFIEIVNRLFGPASDFNQFEIRRHREENLTYFMCYFLAAKALQEGLPISARMSFGFPSTNFTPCATALRMTIGLEDKGILEAYINMFIGENKIFESHLTPGPELTEKIRYLLDKGDLTLCAWIEKHKVELINFAKRHNFIEVMEFIYDKLDPEKMIKEAQKMLVGEDLTWVVSHKNALKLFAKNHYVDKEAMHKFVAEKLIPLRQLINELSKKTSNDAFREWLKGNITKWIDFITQYPLENLEGYADKMFRIIPRFNDTKQFVNSLSNAEQFLGYGSDEFQTKLEDLKEEAFNYAKNHSWEQLQIYVGKALTDLIA